MTNHNAVATSGLLKRYGSEIALDRVDLRVPEGAVYVLIGANGSGKSTLIRILMNLESPDAGAAAVLGLDPFTRGPEVRAQTGYVPERHEYGYLWMNGGRLLRHMAAYFPSWDHAYAEQLTRAFDLSLAKKVG